MAKDDRGDYQTLITQYANKFNDYLANQGGDIEDMQNNNLFMHAYKLTGEAKVDGITDFVDTLIDNNCKFILFAHHLSVLDGLEEFV